MKPEGLRLAGLASWAVLGASFGLSAATWVALAVLAGFDQRLAWMMPVAIDGFVVVALVTWMVSKRPEIAAFARKNTYAAAGAGVLAQSAFHALTIGAQVGVEAWRPALAAVVGAAPPAVAALGVHMRALIVRERSALSAQDQEALTVSAQDRQALSASAISAQDQTLTAHAERSALTERVTERTIIERETERSAERAQVSASVDLSALAERLSAGEVLTGKALGAELGVGQSTARRYLKEARALIELES